MILYIFYQHLDRFYYLNGQFDQLAPAQIQSHLPIQIANHSHRP